jgi:hypothetical protein
VLLWRAKKLKEIRSKRKLMISKTKNKINLMKKRMKRKNQKNKQNASEKNWLNQVEN